jgi:predicted permease
VFQLRLALRRLVGTPFVTVVAVLSLALGIGANAAIFSLFDQMLLRSLPVPEPEQLVNLSAPGPKPGSQSSNVAGRTADVFSYPMFRDLEREQEVFSGLAAHRSIGANLAWSGQTESGEAALVSGSYFKVLQLQPALGRLLGPEDDRTPGGHPVVVLSHGYWRARAGSDPGVIDQTLVVNGDAMTIVGVAPRGFRGTSLGAEPDLFAPLTMREILVPGSEVFEARRSYWVYLFARLQPGTSRERAQAALNVPYGAIVHEVEGPLQEGMSDETMARFLKKQVVLSPGDQGQSVIHGEASAPLTLLLGVTGFVLLIACANVANLLLARGASRAGEMAVRLSIGAGRRHLVGQLLGEAGLLAAIGGVAGVLVARGTLRGVHAMLPGRAAATIQPELDPRVLLFAAGLAVATGLLFGLFPALHATRPDLVTSLRQQAGQASGGRAAARFRTALVTGQIALSMALLVTAGLFTHSLVNVVRVDLGLQAERLLTFRLSPERNGYTNEESAAFFERVEEELAALPGVTDVSSSLVPFLAGSNWGTSVRVEGFDAGPDTDTHSQFSYVGPGFYRTMGVTVLAGRNFTRADAPGTPRVAIVNEAFARKFGLGREAVGKRMAYGRDEGLDIEIVGLVRDTKYSEVKDPPPPQFVTPWRQDDSVGAMSFYARSALEADALLSSVPRLVSRLDAQLPVEDLRTMRQQVRENVFLDRLISTLSTGFALLATILAAVGLYGVLSYAVGQRTRELGVRMALGADGSRLRGMVLGQVARMALVGGVLGLAGALAVARLARSLLFELEGHDPLVLLASAVALGLVAFGAGYVPARQASRVDPMRALRYE